ncbi:hypothetical protein [Bacillus bombysepticus]|uniref:hypothetical protein n=1 Tax=Bacillus bombysepticus TaxID=658666 RepID=UPI00301A94B3
MVLTILSRKEANKYQLYVISNINTSHEQSFEVFAHKGLITPTTIPPSFNNAEFMNRYITLDEAIQDSIGRSFYVVRNYNNDEEAISFLKEHLPDNFIYKKSALVN